MKRNWIISGAVAAMLASASSAALAQDATPAPAPPAAPAPMAMPAPDATPAPPAPMAAPDPTAATPPAPMAPDATTAPPAPMAPAPDSTMPMSNPGSLSTGSMPSGSMSTTMAPGSIDYSVLGDPDLNYTDIKKAKALGFSDNEVASMEKIHHYSGVPFTDIVDRVLHGTAFSTLATQYGVRLGDILDVADEKDKIASYETAYEATGTMALKNSGSMGMMSSPSSMSNSSTMTPPMASGTSASMPMAPTKDIVALAMSNKQFSTLVKELKKADLVSALQGPGPFTVFAPTNAAFKKLPKGALKDLEKDPAKLAAVLKYHVLPARVDAATASSMTSPTSPPTLEGSTLQVTASGGTVKINDATVTQADMMATNGIIHGIDTVLMPSDLASTSGSSSSTGTMGTTGTTDTTGTTGTTPSTPTDQTVPPASGSQPSDSTPVPGVSPSTGTTPPATTPDAGTGTTPDAGTGTTPGTGTGTGTTPGTGTTTPSTPAQ